MTSALQLILAASAVGSLGGALAREEGPWLSSGDAVALLSLRGDAGPVVDGVLQQQPLDNKLVAGGGRRRKLLRVIDNNQCDRSCRWTFGFFNRSITGVRVGPMGTPLPNVGSYCKCYNSGHPITSKRRDCDRKIYNKPSDPNTWSTPYDCKKLCVSRDGRSVTIEDVSGKQAEDVTLHCGECSACSDMHDMAVLNNTKDYITTNMTACSTAFASPFSPNKGDLNVLRTCLKSNGIDFTTDGRAWGAGKVNKPTCMDCWTDNIMNTATYCSTNPDCIKKFFDPTNSGAYEGCLVCDEQNSGPEFIKCAGSNRRSSGINSDIQRESNEICKSGYFYHKV